MAKLTRRGFAFGAMAAGLVAQEKGAREITSASVPGDPIAPKVSGGTLPESVPFGPTVEFKRHDVAPKVRPFAMTEVRLLPGVFQKAQEANRKFLYEQTPDRLLHVFRVNAGIASTAQPLGGWEKPDCELRGHFVGHYLSACALGYASSGDKELKARGDYLVAELAKCQQRLQGGYLSAFPIEYFGRLTERKKVWAPFYTLHKIMAGMLDMHQHCGNAQALTVLQGMAKWTGDWSGALTDDRIQMTLDTEYGGIGETLYSLSALAGDAHYAEVGDRFIKKRFFNPLALRRDELRGLHVNTHIPQVIAAARRYEISDDQRFRDVAEFFWQTVVGGRTYVTGGTSNNEGWLVGPNQLAAELKLGDSTNECCCSYNMLKLTRKLYEWTGDPRLFDYYERALLNHRLGTINDDGQTQYYLGVVPGSWRAFGTKYDSFWCCTGSGTEEYAKLNDSIYFHDEEGIYVNLFIASELNWSERGFRLRQQTAFPEQTGTILFVDADQPMRLTLRVRVPQWVAANATVRINGQASDVSGTPGSYLAITRTWAKGDRVEINLPMGLHSESMADDHSLRAILYGPLVLAGKLGSDDVPADLRIGPEGPELKKAPRIPIPEFAAGKKGLDEWIKPGTHPMTFETVGQPEDVAMEPFYKVAAERYSLYWKVS
jgi:uncharacterized protein